MSADFDAWIGRVSSAKDVLDEGLAQRWLASFDLPPASPPGLVPQGVHFALCPPDAPTSELGKDGHPARALANSFLPPIALPRRMWAASAIEFRAPLAIGASLEKTSRIASIKEKSGRSGRLAFVELAHEWRANGTLSILETQTLVYREAAAPSAPLSPPALDADASFDPSAWDAHITHQPDEKLLFRYSALTFNTHRIHYDQAYAINEERYRGLVVHGPLIASLLLQLIAAKVGENTLRRFTFRGVSPAIAGEPLHLVMRANGKAIAAGAFADDGRQVSEASGEL